MLAYDYLKENPQLRDAQLKFNWAELFTNPDTPYAVREELKMFQRVNATPTDAQLFWHKQEMMYNLENDTKYKISDEVYKSKWMDILYTLVQQDKVKVVNATELLLKVRLDYIDINQLSVEEVARFITYYVGNKYLTIYDSLVAALISPNILIADQIRCITNANSEITNANSERIIKRCSYSFIRKMQLHRLYDITQLLRDAPEDRIYNSINEIQAAHDERTEAEVKKLMECNADEWYEYHPRLEEIAKRSHFFLPVTPNALVLRGKQHHNCVATYADKHTQPIYNGCSRLFFTKTGTLELEFEVWNDIVVSTKVRQFKGMSNRNIDWDEDLMQLRLHLTGEPSNILEVKIGRNSKRSIENGA